MPITIEQLQQRLPKTVRYEARANAFVFKPGFEPIDDANRLLTSLMDGYEEYLKALTVSMLSEVPTAFHSAVMNSVLPDKFLIKISRQLGSIYGWLRNEKTTELDQIYAQYEKVPDDEAPPSQQYHEALIYSLTGKARDLAFFLEVFSFKQMLMSELSFRLYKFRNRPAEEDEGGVPKAEMVPIIEEEVKNESQIMEMLSLTQLLELWFTDDDEFMEKYTGMVS